MKVNEIDFKTYVNIFPEILAAVIMYLKNIGAKVYVMEISTPANITLIVFRITEYKEICEKTRAEIIYLDEKRLKPLNSRESLQ
ncbi:MAG: DUF362 domain-containing protein [Promethearchaeota archaeon]